MKIYGIKQINYHQNGCDGEYTTESILDNHFYLDKNNAINNCPDNDWNTNYIVFEIEVN